VQKAQLSGAMAGAEAKRVELEQHKQRQREEEARRQEEDARKQRDEERKRMEAARRLGVEARADLMTSRRQPRTEVVPRP